MEYLPWMQMVETHKERYPEMDNQDAYKLLFQGMLGPEHVISDAMEFKANLERELANLKPDFDQPLIESIRPDGRLARIHLRAWLATGQDLDILVADCLKAGDQAWNTHEEFSSLWSYYLTTVNINPSDFPWQVTEYKLPAIHHSKKFNLTYSPAYRLVLQ